MKNSNDKPQMTDDEPNLATGSGRVGPPESAPEEKLWANETFAVTKEGLAVKGFMPFIPAAALSLAARALREPSSEQLDPRLMEAIDQAVRHHLPDEFPDGLGLPGQPATPEALKK